MNKKGAIIGVIVVAIVVGIAASYSSPSSETVNLDMGRTHGSISTAMGSPILGDPSAQLLLLNLVIINVNNVMHGFMKQNPQ